MRTSDFQIQISDNAISVTTVWDGDQPSSTKALQSIPHNAQGRYLRVVGFANTSNNWNSITEVEKTRRTGNPAAGLGAGIT